MIQLLAKAAKAKVLLTVSFWAWNAVFLAFTGLGILPFYLVPISAEVVQGFVPVELFLSSLLVVLVPVVSTIAGVRLIRSGPEVFGRLFYGVEAPLFVLALARLFLVRELNPGMAYVLGVFLAGCAIYAASLVARLDGRSTAALAGWTALTSVALLAGLYSAILVAFYAAPATAAFLKAFFSFEWLGNILSSARYLDGVFGVLMLLMFALFALSAAVLAVLPFALFALYGRAWWRAARALLERSGPLAPASVTAVVLAAGIAGYVVANHQPQREVLALLSSPPATDAERSARLARAEELRDGLVNAYLAPYRYLSPAQSDRHVAGMYTEVFGVSAETAGEIQAIYDVFARPTLYDGSSLEPDERRRAADRYAEFFDVPIQRGERDVILAALSATYDSDQREAGLLDEGGRKVRVERQELAVVEHGPYAEIELHEVYENQTYEQQELVYLFSLPESAVLTGLWLGDTADRSRRFEASVSPRGAAQAVYRAEVARRVDPALLEQLGPRQYRLRAFPVPPRRVSSPGRELLAPGEDRAPAPPDRLHLWMTFAVVAVDGAWPLPELAERRNAYFDEDTEQEVNGQARRRPDDETWLPPSLPAARPVEPRALSIDLGRGVRVSAEPGPSGPAVPPPGRSYAIVLDRSYSMARHVTELGAMFRWLDERIGASSDLDLYLTSTDSRGEPPRRIDEPRGFDPSATLYYGGGTAAALLQQLHALSDGKAYDAILVITDDRALDQADPAGDRPPAPRGACPPIWFVHAGGALPTGYDDETTEVIQSSGGGVTTELPRAFRQLALGELHAQQGRSAAWEDGYTWTVTHDPSRAAEPLATPRDRAAGVLAALAARQAVRAQLRTPGGVAPLPRPLPPEVLDGAHAIAVLHRIVTPYSSMIVLVDDRQRAALREAEAAADRFEREVETGEEVLTTPSLGGFGGSLTATPEPGEWALLAIALAAMYVLFQRRRSAHAA